MTLHRLTIAASTLLAASCAAPAPRVAPPIVGPDFALRSGAPAEIRFARFDNRLLVEALIEGEGPFTLLFDTGGRNVVTPEVARQLGLDVGASGSISGAGGRDRAAPTRIARYEIGDLVLREQPALVIDLEPIRRAFGFPRLDGLIGAELLSRLVVAIDFERQVLTLAPPEGDRGVRLAIERVDGKPVIAGLIDGVPARIVLDTGDRSALTLFQRFAATSGLDARFAGGEEVVTGHGVGGPIPGRLARIDRLTLSPGLELRGVLARLPSATSGVFAESPLAASLGNEALRRFTVTLDYRGGQIFLRPNRALGEPFRFVPPPGTP